MTPGAVNGRPVRPGCRFRLQKNYRAGYEQHSEWVAQYPFAREIE